MDANHGSDFNLPSPVGGVPVQGQPTMPQAQVASIQPDTAADDLDKEWISKAKHIVEQTKHDPFLQSNELSKVKAEYLRVRFNKHAPLSKDQHS